MLTSVNAFAKQYAHNIYSQNGEDGILSELCRRLGITPEWVCEFGAWDGIFLSNTFQFIKAGAHAVLIEGDVEKYGDLLKTAETHKAIIPIRSYVTANEPSSTLDALLSTTPIPENFDILSIDVDGEDYHIWKSFIKYNPKIVVIEINSLIHPANTTYIHSDVKGYLGTGFGAMLELGNEKGYSFVCHTGNMIFVRSDLFPRLDITYNNPAENFDASWYNNTR